MSRKRLTNAAVFIKIMKRYQCRKAHMVRQFLEGVVHVLRGLSTISVRQEISMRQIHERKVLSGLDSDGYCRKDLANLKE